MDSYRGYDLRSAGLQAREDQKCKNHDAAFKARGALEAVKGDHTVSELVAEYRLHPTMIHQRKRSLLERAAGIFERGGKAAVAAEMAEDTVHDLHAKIVR